MILRSLWGVVMPVLLMVTNVNLNINVREGEGAPTAYEYNIGSDNSKRLIQEPIITVFVHGTRIFPKFYLQELFYSPQGLWLVKDIDKKSHMHTIARTLSEQDPTKFNYDLFYAFGWDGNLSFEGRKKEALLLYNSLVELDKEYFAIHGNHPRKRLIGHSHGVNVILNMAGLPEAARSNLFIDEAVLLAGPVQQETENYVSSALFGKIWSFSSRFDVIQRIDPQGLHNGITHSPFFSQRYYKPAKNLTQARVVIDGRSIFHIEFFLKKFLKKLPGLMDALDAWSSAHEDAWQKIACVDVRNNKFVVTVER